ncbi:hypothetical protein D4764_08G0000960 [Takifugu flavidus]|uniref:Uncharacterized protein n=1 Tax=Takifugu flavidus TaxID=433684 RepID=A0A5C6MMW3_9TELE|nr:hypothetical protein D4764_08G0000960 [Takifugu flavidus]
MAHGDPKDKNLFADLLKRMMQLDQDERITPLEVLQHPFLNESSPQGPLENNAVSLPGPDEHWRDVHRGVLQQKQSPWTAENSGVRRSTLAGLANGMKTPNVPKRYRRQKQSSWIAGNLNHKQNPPHSGYRNQTHQGNPKHTNTQ